MYRILAVVSLLYLALLATAAPLLVHQVEELSAPQPVTVHRRQGAFEPVTGINEFGIQPRLEIRQLEQDADQWNIYLLGLVRFYATNQTDKLSYYQIAGKVDGLTGVWL